MGAGKNKWYEDLVRARAENDGANIEAVLEGVAEHMEWSTPQGMAAYDAVCSYLNRMRGIGVAASEWQPIETAPKDGSHVWVKREIEGKALFEGVAVFASLAPQAPMRLWSDGGLNGPIPPDDREADEKRWCKPDRMFRIPTPTHWKPLAPIETEGGDAKQGSVAKP